MTRLIVEDGGKRRAFKVGDGTLTIGSGGGASLRLSDPAAAEVHAELLLREGRATLRLKPGVLPPRVAGRPAQGETAVGHGQTIQIGASRITVELPGGARGAAAASVTPMRRRSPAGSTAPARGATAPAPARGSRRARQEEPEEESQYQGSRAWRERKKKDNATRYLLIFLGAPLLIVGVGYLISLAIPSDAEEHHPELYLGRAQEHLERGEWDLAQSDLDEIDLERCSIALRRTVGEVQERVDEEKEKRQLAFELQNRGTRYLDRKIKEFEKERLQGVLEHPKLRVYVKRLRYFKATWPEHPEMAWVEGQLERFGDRVDLSVPPTFADIEFEIKMLRGSNPRDWPECFRILERFQESAVGAELDAAVSLEAQTRADRDEWVSESIKYARWHFELGTKGGKFDSSQLGKSVSWLVRVIQYADDPGYEDDAARRLLAYETSNPPIPIKDWFNGYRLKEPEIYDRLMQNPLIKSYAREKGLPLTARE